MDSQEAREMFLSSCRVDFDTALEQQARLEAQREEEEAVRQRDRQIFLNSERHEFIRPEAPSPAAEDESAQPSPALAHPPPPEPWQDSSATMSLSPVGRRRSCVRCGDSRCGSQRHRRPRAGDENSFKINRQSTPDEDAKDELDFGDAELGDMEEWPTKAERLPVAIAGPGMAPRMLEDMALVLRAAPSSSSGAPASLREPEPPGKRVCSICTDEYEPAEMETFCGTHLYCRECTQNSVRADLDKFLVPRCPDCKTRVDEVAAQYLLTAEDLEHYQRLALWTNDGVTACPGCNEGLYADAGEDPGAKCGTVWCPSCKLEFCVICRKKGHKGVPDCEEAARLRREGKEVSNVAPRPRRAMSLSCSCAGNLGGSTSSDEQTLGRPFHGGIFALDSIPPPPQPFNAGFSTATGSNELLTITSAMDTIHGASMSLLNLKRCPRCRAPMEKADAESCDHMTCLQCRHEFCWSCLADRFPIIAHGNHFHRPNCQFFFEYKGPLEYKPDKCKRCARTGKPCKPPNGIFIEESSIGTVMNLNSVETMLCAMFEFLTFRGCKRVLKM